MFLFGWQHQNIQGSVSEGSFVSFLCDVEPCGALHSFAQEIFSKFTCTFPLFHGVHGDYLHDSVAQSADPSWESHSGMSHSKQRYLHYIPTSVTNGMHGHQHHPVVIHSRISRGSSINDTAIHWLNAFNLKCSDVTMLNGSEGSTMIQSNLLDRVQLPSSNSHQPDDPQDLAQQI